MPNKYYAHSTEERVYIFLSKEKMTSGTMVLTYGPTYLQVEVNCPFCGRWSTLTNAELYGLLFYPNNTAPTFVCECGVSWKIKRLEVSMSEWLQRVLHFEFSLDSASVVLSQL